MAIALSPIQGHISEATPIISLNLARISYKMNVRANQRLIWKHDLEQSCKKNN